MFLNDGDDDMKIIEWPSSTGGTVFDIVFNDKSIPLSL